MVSVRHFIYVIEIKLIKAESQFSFLPPLFRPLIVGNVSSPLYEGPEFVARLL